ncbi:hypothetical protein [Mesorhizobium onobrychidis]|uniref:Uncharacterized protein n=1 Tax=Mesorhizobium onobrychidis TaxID=2775404 RepID=A0ABY5R4M3_9HYPH|nr:hypothetical protein [Mesorhizobium onobrychidis]UVC17917.1 hypothetical protein IHQ72_12970 [Mesorhizobium onobrychidis]
MDTDHKSSGYEITVRISSLTRLFNSLDPTPFRERDLDREAESFIVEWAQEAPQSAPILIAVELPKSEQDQEAAQMLADAVRYNFTDRSAQATRELHELLRIGRRAMLVGLPILALSLIAGQLIGSSSAAAAPARVIGESLLILGWVANWRPLEIFLYEWWPIVRRRTLYRRLAEAKVEIRWAEGDLASEKENGRMRAA